MTPLTITQVYGWNILVAAGMALHIILIGGWAASARKKYKVDYPDMGNGRFSAKLTDEQWKDFNNHQRAHYNYVEGIASAITLQLLGGVYYPQTVAILGVVYLIGRQLYAYGYIKNGASGRTFGVALLDIALVAKFVLVIHGSLKLLEYI